MPSDAETASMGKLVGGGLGDVDGVKRALSGGDVLSVEDIGDPALSNGMPCWLCREGETAALRRPEGECIG